jgi:RNA polymerase sigma-70 factor (ECF subfamily)
VDSGPAGHLLLQEVTLGTPKALRPAAARSCVETGQASDSREKPTLEDLYDAHFDFVWRSLRRLGVAESALDDAAQDVFLVVHRRLAGYEPRYSARTWLFAIVRRVARDHRRRVQRKGGLSPLPDDVPAASQRGPLELTMQSQATRIVHEFLETLDDDRRAVFTLAELEQMNAHEISDALEVNQSTVYSRLGSARRALATFLQSRYPDEFGGSHG